VCVTKEDIVSFMICNVHSKVNPDSLPENPLTLKCHITTIARGLFYMDLCSSLVFKGVRTWAAITCHLSCSSGCLIHLTIVLLFRCFNRTMLYEISSLDSLGFIHIQTRNQHKG
jgi:hypothetical protein